MRCFLIIWALVATSIAVLDAQEIDTTPLNTNEPSPSQEPPSTVELSSSDNTPTVISEPALPPSSDTTTTATSEPVVTHSSDGSTTASNEPATSESSANSTAPINEPSVTPSSDNSTSTKLTPTTRSDGPPPPPPPTKETSGPPPPPPHPPTLEDTQEMPDDDPKKSSDRSYPFVINLKEYQLNNFNDLQDAQRHLRIAVGDLEVPAGVTLDFNLLKGTILTFKGRITFGYKEWEGPLVRIAGRNVKVFGPPGNLFDGDGKRWWDGKGGNGGKDKPKFLALRLKNSLVSGLHFKNAPVHGISINSCQDLTVSWINFDNREGAYKGGGHNTDAFDVGNSDGIIISDSTVYNQDDCLAINSGTNIQFFNNYCSGGHGISIGSVGGRKMNVVANVVIRDSTVAESDNGIRVKTVVNKTGEVTNVKFENIKLVNIKSVGVRIQGNYLNGGPKGDPTPGVPISKLTMWNVNGNVLPGGANYLVWVANASDWWFNTNIQGGTSKKNCTGFPPTVTPLC